MNQISISTPLGRLAFAQTASEGQHLEQDQRTGLWRTVPVGRKLTMLEKAKSSSLYRNVYVRTTLGILVGGILATAINQWSSASDKSKSFNSPNIALAPPAPKSINMAESSYVLEPTDPSKLPPPIEAGPLPEQSTESLHGPGPTVLAAADVQPAPSRQTQTLDAKPAPEVKTAPVAPVAPVVPVVAVAPVKAVAPAAKPQAAPAKPAPVAPQKPSITAPVIPIPQAKAQPKVQSAEPASTASRQEEGKVMIFNEPQRQEKAASALPTPVADTTQPQVKTGVRMLAVQGPTSIVVTNPTNRLPMVVKIGESLPDGTVLKSIDKAASTAVNSRGDVLVLK